MIYPRQQLGRELLAIRFDASDSDAAEADAVVAARAADESRALQLSLRLPVGERDLERAVHRFRSGVAEEHAIEVARHDGRQFARELERERMSHLKRRRVVHDARLLANGGGDRLAAMAGIHAPQTSRPVQNLAA